MRQLLSTLLLGLLLGQAQAHPMPGSVVLLDIQAQSVGATLQIPLSELGLAMNTDLSGELTATAQAEVGVYLLAHVGATSPDGRAWTVQVAGLELIDARQTAAAYRELEARLALTPPQGSDPRVFTLHYDAVIAQVPTHTALVSVRQDWQSGITPETGATAVGVFRLNPVSGRVDVLEVDRSGGSLWRGLAGMFRLGLAHIAQGTDHLLFLLTLLLPAVAVARRRRWAGFVGVRGSLLGILKIVTAFTLGHSLTLILGALLRVNIPPQPVEALIALSILVSAVHALRPVFVGREAWVAAGFGLIHGMAFSFTLSELQLDGPQMALSLLGFNLGIEAMQLAVIALTIPWLILLARTPLYAPVRAAGALVAAAAALGWLGQRLGWANPLGSLADALSPYGVWVIAALALLALVASSVQRLRTGAAR